MVFEVADHRDDTEAVVAGGDRGGSVAQHRLAHVEGNETPQPTGVVQRVEQERRLLRRPRPQLHQRVGSERRHIARVRRQDLALPAGRVVLLEPSDLVEQL